MGSVISSMLEELCNKYN